MNPAAYLQHQLERKRWERRDVDLARDGARLDLARAEDARRRMGLLAVPEPTVLVWPLPDEAGMFSTATATATATRLWRALRRSSLSDVQTWLWVAQDWLLHAERILLPERRGRQTVGEWLLIRRTAPYYARGSGGVNLDRRELFALLVKHLRPRTIPARHLCAAGVRIQQGATTGYYRFDDDQYTDLLVVVQALEAHGVRLPAHVPPPRVSMAVQASTEIQVEYRGGYMPCPRPEHHDENPSAVPYVCGGVYCYGCQTFVGEWRDAAIRDWSRPVRYDRSLREQEREAQANGLPTDMVIRLYGVPDVVPGPPQLVALEGGAAAPRGRGGRRAGAGRRCGSIYSTCHSNDPASSSAFAFTPGSDTQSPSVDGQPGEHPLANLTGCPSAELDRDRWRHPGRQHPTSATWTSTLMLPPLDLEAWGPVRTIGYLRADEFATTAKRGMTRRHDPQFDLIELQRQADGRSHGDGETRLAHGAYIDLMRSVGWRQLGPRDLVDPRLLATLPEPTVRGLRHLHQHYVSVGLWRRDGLRRARRGPVETVRATQFSREVCTRYVLIDIDGLTIPRLPADPEQAAAYAKVSDGYLARGPRKLRARRYYAHLEVGDQAIARAAQQVQNLASRHPDYTGRVYVLRTGPAGVQVAAELRQTRWDTRALWACQDFRAQVQGLAQHVLGALHAEGCSGGQIDPSSFAHGRLGRRAGWRLAKDGTLFRARLIYATPCRPWEI